MKDKIIEILFSWLFTPVLHLNLAQIFIALAELAVIAYGFIGIDYIARKIKNKKRRAKYVTRNYENKGY